MITSLLEKIGGMSGLDSICNVLKETMLDLHIIGPKPWNGAHTHNNKSGILGFSPHSYYK